MSNWHQTTLWQSEFRLQSKSKQSAETDRGMRGLLCVIASQFIFLCALTDAYATPSSFPACVQTALNKLGYEAGPVDGVLGAKSKSAADAYRADNPALHDMRDLANETAIDWCLLLGSLHKDVLPIIPVIFVLDRTNPSVHLLG